MQCDPASDLNLEHGIPTRPGKINLIASFLHFSYRYFFIFDMHSLNQTKNYKKKMCVKMSAVLRQSHWISKLLVTKSHDPCLQEARGGTAVDMSAGGA